MVLASKLMKYPYIPNNKVHFVKNIKVSFEKVCTLVILTSVFLFTQTAFASYVGGSQTWSESAIRDIVKDELKGTDIDSVKSIIKQESEDFEQKLEIKINQQQNNFIEIIGLFAAVLALIAVDLSIIRTAKNFKEALWLMIAFTISLLLFATLIHLFFQT
ncbi:hypothetical protein EPO17_01350 [Patescibacteria group bacterium]|nr:MAG: hypothetical protein EPO17_01350 [Patescibacteria group bacterium]